MTQKQLFIIGLAALCLYAGVLAGYQNTDDILYQRLDGIDMPEDSIEIVMALPRELPFHWESGSIVCTAYLAVDDAVAAAAIVYVNGKCFEERVLFNYNYLRRGKK